VLDACAQRLREATLDFAAVTRPLFHDEEDAERSGCVVLVRPRGIGNRGPHPRRRNRAAVATTRRFASDAPTNLIALRTVVFDPGRLSTRTFWLMESGGDN